MKDTLEKLKVLAQDLASSTSFYGEELWSYVDKELFLETKNPWLILQKLSNERLQDLKKDSHFEKLLQKHYQQREKKLSEPGFFEKTYPKSSLKGCAFFSMEFGLSEALPIYSGGLGILAGDFLKAANDLKVPVVGVGLLYQQGYFRQLLDEKGLQKEFYPFNDPSQLPVTRVCDSKKNPLCLSLQLPGRTLKIRVYKAHIETVPLYLLDTNELTNSPLDRGITDELYNAQPQSRLLQEMVLGIGGYRLLKTLNIPVDLCHLNEGHAAFAILERARYTMIEKKVSFLKAFEEVRKTNLFTTHTAVAASFDHFDKSLLKHYLSDYLKTLDLSFSDFFALGKDQKQFNMAFLALKGSAHVNGVSKLHGKVSKQLFAPQFPQLKEEKVPITSVTNGVHLPTWISQKAHHFLDTKDIDLFERPQHFAKKLESVSDEEILDYRDTCRKDLVQYARKRLEKQIDSSGYHEEKPDDLKNLLQENILTIGFARRFAPYKRTNLLLKDPKRLLKICQNTKMPLQLIIAGKAHPRDEEGKKMVAEWTDLIRHTELRQHVIFLSDYDMLLAERMVQGIDLWINMPKRPWEACGTSGMKLIINGGLNLSELDGWWDEAYQSSLGWALPNKEEGSDDTKEANNLYDLLEKEVLPTFYTNKKKWADKIRNSLSQLSYPFSANRMVKEYLEKHYLPALKKGKNL